MCRKRHNWIYGSFSYSGRVSFFLKREKWIYFFLIFSFSLRFVVNVPRACTPIYPKDASTIASIVYEEGKKEREKI